MKKKIEHAYRGKKTGVWAEMVCDSVWEGRRLSTVVVRLPRAVLAELNTHKDLSRNSASSRAIPAKTMRERVLADPYIPWRWPVNGKGMTPTAYRDTWPLAGFVWRAALLCASLLHRALAWIGVHKEVTNRILEPWMWTEVLITATEWSRLRTLRAHPAAQDGLRAAVECVRDLLEQHTPAERKQHLPYVTEEEALECPDVLIPMLASSRRCRRVSYLRQGVRVDLFEDAQAGMGGLLESPAHMSPYEHMAVAEEGRHANLTGWRSLRSAVEDGFIDYTDLCLVDFDTARKWPPLSGKETIDEQRNP